MSDDDARAAHDAARDAGLERLLALDADAVTRAYTQVRGFAQRLERPSTPTIEPTHVYRLDAADD